VAWFVAGILGACAVLLGFGWWRERARLRPLREAFDVLPVRAQFVARDDRPIRSNAAARAWLPERDDNLAALLAGAAAEQADADALADLVRGAREGRAGCAEVNVRWTADGAARYAVHACPLASPQGAVAWFVADATARPGEHPETTHARLAGLLDDAPVGFFVVDERGHFRVVNATLAAWLGRSPEVLTSGACRLHDVVPTVHANAPAYSVFAPGTADAYTRQSGEVAFRTAEDEAFTAHVVQDLLAGDGGGLAVCARVRNLSRERAAAAAAEQSEQRFRSFFEHAPLGIALLDDHGGIEVCNASFAELLGREPRALHGMQLPELVHPQDRDAVAKVLEAEVERDDESADVHAPDGERVFSVFTKRLDAADMGAERLVYLIEMTRHKQLEQQVAQSQKMQAIGQLAGAVAHDFNNLLTAMIGFCDLLLLRHRAGDQSFADLMQIKQNANRAANLVRQLLAFSRQQTLRPTVLSVTDVLVELNHLLRRLIGERITLTIEHGSGLYPVKVDQGQLEQVIINLAVNARDAMADTGGHLDIRTGNADLDRPQSGYGETVPPGQYVRIDVRDTGCGISKESLPRVFEPFFSTKEVGEGTGLGLATVHGIIKQTGGYIQLDSTVGEGTVFSIYLPRHRETSDQAVARETETSGAHDLTGMGTVLLVEDEDAVRAFSARALRKKGYTVLEARSGEAALTMLRERGEPVDLLITDVVMPEMEGPALVARIRDMQPDVRVIYISGYAQDSLRASLDDSDGARFLPKPFTLKQLAGAVKDAMYDGA